jgi:hypothetical protein
MLAHALSIAIGLTGAWLAMGLGSLYCTAFFSGTGAFVIYLRRASGSTEPGYQSGLLAGVLAMCCMGLVLVFGLLGVLWVCTLLATTTPLRTLWHRHRPEVRPATPEHDFTAPHRPPSIRTTMRAAAASTTESLHRAALEVPDLDLDALCLSWRRSYFQLLEAGQTRTIAAVVDYRQRILDEIDRRDPHGLQGWLASVPRPSANPRPYMHACVASADDQEGTPRSSPDPHAGSESCDPPDGQEGAAG